MSRSTNIPARRRTAWLLAGALLISSLAGCTSFQTMTTNKWLATNWIDGQAEEPIHQMLVVWDKHLRHTQNSENFGAPLPGVAGRLFLFNEDTKNEVEARGRIVVQMRDLTNATMDKPGQLLGEWSIPSGDLKKLRKKDPVAVGYTLFLPWDTYQPSVKRVHLTVCYVPESGPPRFGAPTQVTFESDSPLIIQERHVMRENPPQQRPTGPVESRPTGQPSSPFGNEPTLKTPQQPLPVIPNPYGSAAQPQPGYSTQIQYGPPPQTQLPNAPIRFVPSTTQKVVPPVGP